MATGWYKANGVITRYSNASDYSLEDIEDAVEPGGGYIIADEIDRNTQYVVDGALTDRPALDVAASYTITANGVDAVTFDIPDGTRVYTVSLDERKASVDGSTSFVDDVAAGDDTFTFTSRRRGRWELAVNTPEPVQRYVITVDAI